MSNFEIIVEVLGVKCADIARRTGISKQSVSDWKFGRRKIPKKHHHAICEFLGLDQEDFESALEYPSEELKLKLLEQFFSKKLGRKISIS